MMTKSKEAAMSGDFKVYEPEASRFDEHRERVSEARALSEMRTARAPKLTDERRQEIRTEMSSLNENLADQSPEERLRRYERMFELGRERGYVYDPDPIFDVIRMRRMRQWMAEAQAEIDERNASGTTSK